MKKSIVGLMAIVALLTACGKNETTSPPIGGAFYPIGENLFRKYVLTYFVYTAQLQGHPAARSVRETPAQQAEDIRTMLHQGIRSIVVTDMGLGSTFIDSVRNAGMRIVFYDIAPSVSDYECYVRGDQYAVGEYCAKFLRARGGAQKVAVLRMTNPYSNSRERIRGLQENLLPSPAYTVFDIPDYGKKYAEEALKKIVDSGEAFDAIFTQDGEIAYEMYKNLDVTTKIPSLKFLLGTYYIPFLGLMGGEQKVDLCAGYYSPLSSAVAATQAIRIVNGSVPEKKDIIIASDSITKHNYRKYVTDGGGSEY